MTGGWETPTPSADAIKCSDIYNRAWVERSSPRATLIGAPWWVASAIGAEGALFWGDKKQAR